jgi:hypothetical protein
VGYNGKFFDPTYGCQYENLTDMAFLTITGFGIEGADPQPTLFAKWDNEADNDSTGKYFLRGKTSDNVDYRLNVRKVSDTASYLYDGPIPLA